MRRPRKYHTEEERRAAIRAGHRKYYAAHREAVNEKTRARRSMDPEKTRASNRKAFKEWYYKHRAAQSARVRAWRVDNADLVAQYNTRSALNKRKHALFIAGCVIIDTLGAGRGETNQHSG